MKALTLSLILLSLSSINVSGSESLLFSNEELEKLSKSSKPQKTRNIEKIDQKTDVIYFNDNDGLNSYDLAKKIDNPEKK